MVGTRLPSSLNRVSLLAISFLVLVKGQSSLDDDSQDLVFNTSFPATYIIGQLGNVTWSGGNGQPVNVSLVSGDSEEQRICTNAVNTSCTWIPSPKIDTTDIWLLQLAQNGTGTSDEGPVYVDAANTSTSSSSATSSPTSTSQSISTSATSTASIPAAAKSSSSINGGAIAGIVIGAVAAVALVGIAILLWRRKVGSSKPPETSNDRNDWSKAELSGEHPTSSSIGGPGKEVGVVGSQWNSQAGGSQRFEADGSQRYELPGAGPRS